MYWEDSIHPSIHPSIGPSIHPSIHYAMPATTHTHTSSHANLHPAFARPFDHPSERRPMNQTCMHTAFFFALCSRRSINATSMHSSILEPAESTKDERALGRLRSTSNVNSSSSVVIQNVWYELCCFSLFFSFVRQHSGERMKR